MLWEFKEQVDSYVYICPFTNEEREVCSDSDICDIDDETDLT